jgi:hypothetical protein
MVNTIDVVSGFVETRLGSEKPDGLTKRDLDDSRSLYEGLFEG